MLIFPHLFFSLRVKFSFSTVCLSVKHLYLSGFKGFFVLLQLHYLAMQSLWLFRDLDDIYVYILISVHVAKDRHSKLVFSLVCVMVTSLTVLNYAINICRSPVFVVILRGEFALKLMGDLSVEKLLEWASSALSGTQA